MRIAMPLTLRAPSLRMNKEADYEVHKFAFTGSSLQTILIFEHPE
jgi:hypothetical protein